MRKLTVPAVLASLLLMTGIFPAAAADWPLFRGNSARLGISSETLEPPLTLVWQFHTGAKILSSPAVSGNTVYFGSSDGFVYAVDAVTGAQKWRYDGGGAPDTPSRGITSSPCVDGGVVYVGTLNGHLMALKADTGARLWDAAVGGQNISSPIVSNGLVFSGTGYPDKTFLALRASDGHKVWSFEAGQFVHSSPAIAGARVFVGANDGNYRAFNAADGTLAWTFETMGGVYMNTPAVSGGKLYCAPGDYDRRVFALDSQTGNELWEFTVPTQSWQQWIYVSSPAVANGLVYIVGGYPNAILYALDASSGEKRWESRVGPISTEAFAGSPAISGNTVYVGGWDGALSALDAATGASRWSSKLPGGIGSSPAVANGWLYVGCGNGDLYAFAHTAPTMEFSSPPDFVRRGWNLISLPAIPVDPDPLAALAGLDVPNASLQFWRNDVNGGGFQSYGIFAGWSGPLTVGTPYWLLHQGDPVTIHFQGSLITTDQTLTIPAHDAAPYWAMLSLPMNHAVACDDLRFSTPSRPTPVDWSTAYSGGLIESNAIGFDAISAAFFTIGPTSPYVDRVALSPWYGYWFMIRTTEPLQIHFPIAPTVP